MININKKIRDGATLKELIEFVEECKAEKISLDTPVKISQSGTYSSSCVVDMIADEESIIFYNWI